LPADVPVAQRGFRFHAAGNRATTHTIKVTRRPRAFESFAGSCRFGPSPDGQPNVAVPIRCRRVPRGRSTLVRCGSRRKL